MLGLLGGSAGLEFLGGIYTNQTNRSIARDANIASQGMSREQMEFQERMSSSAHQRAVADLKKAGLNPLLAANTGASSPAGSMGQVTAATVENPLEGLASTAAEIQNLKLAAKKQGQEIDLMKDQSELTKAQTRKTNVDAEVAKRGIPKADIINKLYQGFKTQADKVKKNWNNYQEAEKDHQLYLNKGGLP